MSILPFAHFKHHLVLACYCQCSYCCDKPMTLYVSLWIMKDLQSQCRLSLTFIFFNSVRRYHFSPSWVFVPADLQRIGKKLSLSMKILAKSSGNLHFSNFIAQCQPWICYCTLKDTPIKISLISILLIWN